MGPIYLKFKDEKVTKISDNRPKTWVMQVFEKSVVKILTAIIPKSNPGFEEKFQYVNEWLIEIDGEEEIANREIGIDNSGQTIMIMPFKENYGYWTDNNLKSSDFIKVFQAIRITQKEFNERWDEFKKNPK